MTKKKTTKKEADADKEVFAREVARRVIALPTNTTSSGVTEDEVAGIVLDVIEGKIEAFDDGEGEGEGEGGGEGEGEGEGTSSHDGEQAT